MTDSADDTILLARDLELAYGRQSVLRAVHLHVRRGERWFILGPNGHGKTTLLRGLLGLIPTRGDRLVRGSDMHPRHLGFVPQRIELNPTLATTITEFVALGLVGLALTAAQRRQRVGAALEEVGLGDRAGADYWSLSGGQRQRCALARALAREPRVLLLDEPTAGLDLSAEEALMRTLMAGSRQPTILLVTHHIELAARYASHAALVFDGSVHAGPVDEVLRPDLLEAAYGVPIQIISREAGSASIRIGRPAEGG